MRDFTFWETYGGTIIAGVWLISGLLGFVLLGIWHDEKYRQPSQETITGYCLASIFLGPLFILLTVAAFPEQCWRDGKRLVFAIDYYINGFCDWE